MPQPLPFPRTVRSLRPAENSGASSWKYIRDLDYARDPQHYLRAFLLIQQDLSKLFEYIEPSNLAAKAYSFRTHELLMRTCIEVEANFRAILQENGFPTQKASGAAIKTTMIEYKKVNVSHHLSSYEVQLPLWAGGGRIFKPFAAWANSDPLDWYQAYNASKHDRHEAFKAANLEMLVTAVAGLLTLIMAQFGEQDFSLDPDVLSVSGNSLDGFITGTGRLFRIKPPNDWSDAELYDFDWRELEKKPIKFAKFDYTKV